jgi:hypothetical protein
VAFILASILLDIVPPRGLRTDAGWAGIVFLISVGAGVAVLIVSRVGVVASIVFAVLGSIVAWIATYAVFRMPDCYRVESVVPASPPSLVCPSADGGYYLGTLVVALLPPLLFAGVMATRWAWRATATAPDA